MLSYHSDPWIKVKYLARVKKHREMDNLVQGTGWTGAKGCAVGCTLESYDHYRYPIELGIPAKIAHLEDTIFEHLPWEHAKDWPERFLRAVPVGVDLSSVLRRIEMKRMDWVVERLEKLLREGLGHEDSIVEAIDVAKGARGYHDAALKGEYVDQHALLKRARVSNSLAERECRSERTDLIKLSGVMVIDSITRVSGLFEIATYHLMRFFDKESLDAIWIEEANLLIEKLEATKDQKKNEIADA